MDSRVRHGARLGLPTAASPPRSSQRRAFARRLSLSLLAKLGLLNWAQFAAVGVSSIFPSLLCHHAQHQSAMLMRRNEQTQFPKRFASRTRRGQHAVSLRARDAHETPRGYPVKTSRVAAGRASRLAPHAVVARVSSERVVSTHRGPSSARDGSPQISRRLRRLRRIRRRHRSRDTPGSRARSDRPDAPAQAADEPAPRERDFAQAGVQQRGRERRALPSIERRS